MSTVESFLICTVVTWTWISLVAATIKTVLLSYFSSDSSNDLALMFKRSTYISRDQKIEFISLKYPNLLGFMFIKMICWQYLFCNQTGYFSTRSMKTGYHKQMSHTDLRNFPRNCAIVTVSLVGISLNWTTIIQRYYPVFYHMRKTVVQLSLSDIICIIGTFVLNKWNKNFIPFHLHNADIRYQNKVGTQSTRRLIVLLLNLVFQIWRLRPALHSQSICISISYLLLWASCLCIFYEFDKEINWKFQQ